MGTGALSRAVELIRSGQIRRLGRGACNEIKRLCQTKYELLEADLRYLGYKLKYQEAAPDPYNVVEIDPARVNHILAPNFQVDRSKASSYVRGGDWDQRTADEILFHGGKYEDSFDRRQIVPFENYALYQAFVEHFEHGAPWEETEWYEWLIANSGEDTGPYGDREAIEERLSYLDDLYTSIKQDGYKSSAELGDIPTYAEKHPGLCEVLINIGRDGKHLLDDGRPRFILAKILGVDRITARVFVRHTEWQRLRYEVATTGATEASDRQKEQITHPDVEIQDGRNDPA
jgi:hypothetical protein